MAAGAVLTQNTAWTNVDKALRRLAAARALTPRRIASLPARRLQGLIRSSGYFRQKALRLRGLSKHLLARWGGRLDRLLERSAGEARAELLSLNGVGPETADSILLYAGRHPVFVVDAYTRRIGRRFGLLETDDYDEVQRFFMRRMTPTVHGYREFHALLVELAKRFCRTEPDCPPCPLRARCAAGKG
jgi:endonuclease-3 related protein